MQNIPVTMRDVRNETRKTTEAFNSMYEEMNSIMSDTYTQIGMIEHYSEVLKNASDETLNNAAARAELEQAIGYLNDATGENYEIIGDGNKILEDERQALLKAGEAAIKSAQDKGRAAAAEKAWEQYYEQKNRRQEAELKYQQAYNDAMEVLLDTNSSFAEKLKASHDLSSAEQNLNNMADAERAAAEAAGIASGAYDGMTQGMTNGAAKALAAMKDVEGIATVTDKLGFSIETVSAMLDGYGINLDEMASLSQEDWNEIIESWQSGDQTIGTLAELIKEKVGSLSGQTPQLQLDPTAAQSAVDQYVTDVGGALEGALAQFATTNTAGLAFSQKFAASISEGSDDVGVAAGKVADAATSELDDAADDTTNSGINFIKGFIYGLNDDYWRGLAALTVSGLGTMLVGEFNKSLGEHSPSRYTRQSGRYFTEGFALGINDEADYAVRQAELLGKAAAYGLEASAMLSSAKSVMSNAYFGDNSQSTSVAYQVVLNGAVLNDDAEIQAVSRSFLAELKRKAN